MRALILLLILITLPLSAENWDGFDFEEMGLTRGEFQVLKRSNITKEQFYELLLIGVLPSEYLSKPWEDLHVSEEQWFEQRKLGMNDEDIDRSWKANQNKSYHAYASLLLPGWYQYRERQYWKGILSNSLTASGLLTYSVMRWGMQDPSPNWALLFSLSGSLFSFVDAWLQLPTDVENEDLKNFSFHLLPTSEHTFFAQISLQF